MKDDLTPADWFAWLRHFCLVPFALCLLAAAPAAAQMAEIAALQGYDFMLNKAQEIMMKRDFIPSSARVAATPKDVPQLSLIDPKVVLDEGEKWVKLYDEIFVKQAR